MATRLHLQQIEIPSDADDMRSFEIQMIRDQKFSGKRVVVDNHQFENCEFRNCNFVFSGGHFAFANCTLEERCEFSPTGAAYKAMRLFEALEEQLRWGVPPV